jgi:hypothetical protein
LYGLPDIQQDFHLTHSGNPGDAPNTPHSGFQTVRFGHGLFGAYGELDVYCDLPKADFALAVILMYTSPPFFLKSLH